MLSNESASESVSGEAMVVVCLEEELADNIPSLTRLLTALRRMRTASNSAATNLYRRATRC